MIEKEFYLTPIEKGRYKPDHNDEQFDERLKLCRVTERMAFDLKGLCVVQDERGVYKE
jgi:hypothetical protein